MSVLNPQQVRIKHTSCVVAWHCGKEWWSHSMDCFNGASCDGEQKEGEGCWADKKEAKVVDVPLDLLIAIVSWAELYHSRTAWRITHWTMWMCLCMNVCLLQLEPKGCLKSICKKKVLESTFVQAWTWHSMSEDPLWSYLKTYKHTLTKNRCMECCLGVEKYPSGALHYFRVIEKIWGTQEG